MQSPQNNYFSQYRKISNFRDFSKDPTKSPKSPFFKISPTFLRFFRNNTHKHSSNICSFHVPKENKIHQGISEHSSVQTTINNHAKSQKSPFFKKSPKLQFLRFFKNNTPKHSSNIRAASGCWEKKV